MKKALICVFALFICVSIFAQKQPVVAIAPFNAISGISQTDVNMITRVFNIRLGNTQKVAFVDRDIIDRVLQEHHFQAGDWSNEQKTAELGKALNADWLIKGELELFGTNILVTVQFFNIQTFRFMGGADTLLVDAADAMNKMDPLVNKLLEAITTAQAATAQIVQKYKVGDVGPAGGNIFDVSGNGRVGWTYKEAAPVANEYYGDFNSVSQHCAKLNINGITGWRIPGSMDNVYMQMYLKDKGIGGFSDAWYFSNDGNVYTFHSGYSGRPPSSSARVRPMREFKD
jgi:TolB-like protein